MGLVLAENLFEMVYCRLVRSLNISGDVSLDHILEHFVSIVSEATSEGYVEQGLLVDIFDLVDIKSLGLCFVPSPIVSKARPVSMRSRW